jgi:6,7-dimethyl-8-ribityllumazine synthase
MSKDTDASTEMTRAESGGKNQQSETVKLGLVVAEFNRSVTAEMETTAEEAAADRNATVIMTLSVPGVYDTPLAADRLARREDIDAVAVVGAIVTGDTDHDQVIGDAVAQRLTDVSLERDVPVTFGVSGPGQSGAEARERVGKGAEAVNAAVDMVEVLV